MEQNQEKHNETRGVDLFAQMQAEIATLREENARLITEKERHCKIDVQQQKSRREVAETNEYRPPKKKQINNAYLRRYGSPAIEVKHEDDHSERNRKIFAAIATAIVFVILFYTIGLFGIAAIGLLASGIIKLK